MSQPTMPEPTAAPGAPARGAAATDARTLATLLPLLSAIGFLVSMDTRVIATVLPQVAADFGVSVPLASAAVTAYLLPYGLCQLAYGTLADRVGAMRVIGVAAIGFAVGVLACALAPSLPVLILLRLLTGGIAAAIIPLALATIGNLAPYARRQASVAILFGATSAGQVLSAAIGGVLAQFVNWRAIFVIDGLLAALLIVPLWQRRRATPPLAVRRAGHPFVEHLGLLRDRRALMLYLIVLSEGAFMNGGSTYLASLLHERDGLTFLVIGLILSLFGVGAVLASRVVARLAVRLGEDGLIRGGGLLMAAAFALAQATAGILPMAAAVFAMGVGFTLCHSTLQTRATELRPTARGTAISLFALALFLGGGLGTALLGVLLAAQGYAAVMLVSAVGLATLALLAPGLMRPAPARSAPRR